MNYLRHHSIAANYRLLGLTPPPPNFAVMQPLLYKHLSEEYKNRGELELGEESLTVQPNVFAQIGIIDVNGVRQMWTKAIIPALLDWRQRELLKSEGESQADLEAKVVFCDIGSGVGNVCLQVLSETKCPKSVGVEIIPSRIRAAEEASKRAKLLYSDIFSKKEAVWVQKDLIKCAARLKEEGVTVVFTHSWMFDNDLMTKLTEVIAQVPSIQCVVTSRKLDEKVLASTMLRQRTLMHFSADWNDEAPFYIYGK
ncbi:S-adenosyl-L-methionine-dependent methyltransferase, putative [Leishmania panamensis]|uniref:Histone-lysine N-methyltransferase, H3 lysine-79 specific n=4 Tax=Viannia TaxID=37616 RepID=A0A088RZ95_LEIPA|nr:S-adenosyl-L-methionine-dependent methyltransferase, putative [Leishmania panamensis]AIO01478.1 S-adenosyl-L-methionine-dependent methyltransferase, putative [Leishmania panamensis]